MKLLTTALLCLAITPTLALSAQPWEGYWTHNAAYCANAGEVGEQTPDHYSRKGFFGLEWGCDVTNLQPTGYPQSWSVTLQCMAEGYEYNEERLMLLSQTDRLLFLNQSGVIANMVRCADPAKR